MNYTAKGLAEYCERCLKERTAYMWGTLMNPISADLINKKRNQYPGKYTPGRIQALSALIGKAYACDCSGLIKSYYMGGFGAPEYDAQKDINTAGFFSAAEARGAISTLPEVPGIVLYMDGHVGVYVGGGKAIECTWGAYGDGVVKTNIDGRGWTHWLKIPFVDYQEETQCGCECCAHGNYFTYTVERGDSFRRISKKFYDTEDYFNIICGYNGMSNTDVIHPGDKLKIPRLEV